MKLRFRFFLALFSVILLTSAAPTSSTSGENDGSGAGATGADGNGNAVSVEEFQPDGFWEDENGNDNVNNEEEIVSQESPHPGDNLINGGEGQDEETGNEGVWDYEDEHTPDWEDEDEGNAEVEADTDDEGDYVNDTYDEDNDFDEPFWSHEHPEDDDDAKLEGKNDEAGNNKIDLGGPDGDDEALAQDGNDDFGWVEDEDGNWKPNPTGQPQ
jgi:hypothetical protein